MDWVQQVLLPQIRKIDSRIRLHKVDRAELISRAEAKLLKVMATLTLHKDSPPVELRHAPPYKP